MEAILFRINGNSLRIRKNPHNVRSRECESGGMRGCRKRMGRSAAALLSMVRRIRFLLICSCYILMVHTIRRELWISKSLSVPLDMKISFQLESLSYSWEKCEWPQLGCVASTNRIVRRIARIWIHIAKLRKKKKIGYIDYEIEPSDASHKEGKKKRKICGATTRRSPRIEGYFEFIFIVIII